MICNLLIIFFLLLILYNLGKLLFKTAIVENYENYGDDPMILAQKNAGNIEDLKGQIDGLKKKVDTMDTDLSDVKNQAETNENNITGLMNGNKQAGQEISSKMSEVS